MRGVIALLLIASVLLSARPAAAAGISSESLVVQVYPDGYVLVDQTVAVDKNVTSVEIPLLSTAGSGLVATDQDGSPLSYSFSQTGSNLTVYTLGATSVTLKYTTDSLTSKNGTVWSLAFSALYNATLILPPYSTLVSISGSPYSINVTGNSPEAYLGPGSWAIRYGVSLSGVPGVSTTESTTTTGGASQGANDYLTVEVVAAAGVMVVAAALVAWRRRARTISKGELRPDDLQVLGFIQEKGGKVLEPEIRMRFALPKTSAWRMIKRLERMGYVRVTKVGSQNQIEYIGKREARS